MSQVFAKFDTSEEKLEPLSAELQVKALPVFKFYKVRVNCVVDQREGTFGMGQWYLGLKGQQLRFPEVV